MLTVRRRSEWISLSKLFNQFEEIAINMRLKTNQKWNRIYSFRKGINQKKVGCRLCRDSLALNWANPCVSIG